MAVSGAFARAVPLLAGAAAAGWYLHRRGQLGASSPAPPGPSPPGEPPPPEEVEGVLEREAARMESVSDAADVTAVVEDLLSAQGPGDGTVVDAEVVDPDAADGEERPDR